MRLARRLTEQLFVWRERTGHNRIDLKSKGDLPVLTNPPETNEAQLEKTRRWKRSSDDEMTAETYKQRVSKK